MSMHWCIIHSLLTNVTCELGLEAVTEALCVDSVEHTSGLENRVTKSHSICDSWYYTSFNTGSTEYSAQRAFNYPSVRPSVFTGKGKHCDTTERRAAAPPRSLAHYQPQHKHTSSGSV